MNQLDLALQVPIARKRDSAPSKEAAKAVTVSGKRASQHEMVLQAVRERPGRTSLELSFFTDIGRYVVARRLPELERVHLVRKGEIRQCRVGKRSAVTWWAI